MDNKEQWTIRAKNLAKMLGYNANESQIESLALNLELAYVQGRSDATKETLNRIQRMKEKIK